MNPTDFSTWLFQQAPVVVVLVVLSVALWRRDDDRDRLISANSQHVTALADDVDALIKNTATTNRLILVTAFTGVSVMLVAVSVGAVFMRRVNNPELK